MRCWLSSGLIFTLVLSLCVDSARAARTVTRGNQAGAKRAQQVWASGRPASVARRAFAGGERSSRLGLRPLRHLERTRTGSPSESVGRRFSETGTLGLLSAGVRAVRRGGEAQRAASGATLGSEQILAFLPPVLLAIGSAHALRSARSANERMEASHGLLWAAQASGELVGASGLLTGLLGTAGGSLQVLVGIRRLRAYIGERGRIDRVLGGLDVVAGSSWTATTLTGSTLALGVFVVSSLVKMAVENRDILKRVVLRFVQSWPKLTPTGIARLGRSS